MLTDADLASIQQDFGTLASKAACQVKRGTPSSTTKAIGKPYNPKFTWTCTILSLSQVKDAYLTGFNHSMVQATKNPRVILLPMPMPTGMDVLRGDVIVSNGQDFMVLDTDNTTSYAYQRVVFCNLVEGGQF